MASSPYKGLEIEEDLRFEKRVWSFQRASRYGLALFLILALLGFTGSGPLSNASASSPDNNLTVSYERVDRIGSPSTYQITVTPDLINAGEVQIWIESDLLTKVQLEQITPEPDSIEIGPDRYVFTFPVTGDTSPAPVALHIRPEEPGLFRVTLGIVDGPEVSFRQFVFP